MSGAFVDATEAGVPVESADFVVIGSGAGGGAAARVLAQAGASVAVLEEGPYIPWGYPNPLVREALPALFRNHGKFAAFGKASTPILQGRVVGGTTFVNSAIVWRLPDKVLAAWHRDFGLADGLRHEELDPAYEVLESEMSARPVQEGVNSNRQDLLMRSAAQKAGLESRFMHRYEDGCRGSARCLFGCPNQAKQSVAINALKRAVSDGAAVVAQARVDRVLFEGTKAVGVTGTIEGSGPKKGQAFRVNAKKAVIVAASAIQSPNLLRRSGVRRPGLGDHFMAHPGTSVMGLYPDLVNMWRGASQGYETIGLRDTLGVKLETINVPPEIVASRLPGAGPRLAAYLERLDHLASWAIAIRADAQGTVRPSRILGDFVRYGLNPGDIERLRAGMKKLAEMHFLAGATEVLPGIYGMPDVLRSPDDLVAYDQASLGPQSFTLLMTHLFGGCRAGKDPQTSVVDPHLQVHGYERLYVMDASVFPTNTGVNPQHSIMAITRVAAARLASA